MTPMNSSSEHIPHPTSSEVIHKWAAGKSVRCFSLFHKADRTETPQGVVNVNDRFLQSSYL